MNTLELMRQVYDNISAAYAQPPMPNMPSGNGAAQTFMTYVWPGTLIEEKQFGNAWSPQNPKGSMDVTENISTLVNALPNLSTWHEWSGYTVEHAYELILGGRPVAAAGGGTRTLRQSARSGPGEAAVAESASAVFEELDDRVQVTVPDNKGRPVNLVTVPDETLKATELEAAYADAAAALNLRRQQFDLSDPAQRARWEAVRPDYERAVRDAWAALEASREPAPARSVRRGTRGVTPGATRGGEEFTPNPVRDAFRRANDLFARSRLGSAKEPGRSYYPAYLTPANFADPEASAAWPFVDMIPSQIQAPSGASNARVMFRFTRVQITRPWLTTSLLKMKGWELPGQDPGSISTGTIEDNYGQFPLLPTAMIVVRGLRITPLGANTSGESSVLLNLPGLQVLAWINQVVPFCPPRP